MSGGDDGGGNDDGGGGGAYDLSAYDFEVEESGVSGGNEEEMALAAIFEQAEVRNTFLDDLFELQSFFTQFLAELSAPGGGQAAASLPSGQQLDKAEVETRLTALNEAIDALDSEHARHLLLLGAPDGKYLDRQVSSLRQMLDTAEKMRGRAEELQTRQAELQMTIKGTYPKYEGVVSGIKAAKASLEGALSEHFDGRRVNLMGDINQL